ncbi:PEP-CTERM sorting domain-containing protein [Rubritalea spongiae]|uniref:PEP-CTERM sorting domain-containing protein n=2 Tax=Rubritalea spongiae TaxID=430797 RepID=A0ABW5E3R3_9BACT
MKSSTIITSLLASAGISQAAVIYSEDFTGQTGQGENDTSSVDWSVNLDGNPSVFGVTTATTNQGVDIGEHFRATNTNAGGDSATNDEGASWISPLIDTTSFSGQQLNFNIDVTPAGALGFYEAEDIVEIFYSVDGGPAVSLGDLITANDNFNGQTGGNTTFGITQTIEQNFIAGNSLQLEVLFNLNANSNETVAIDNISVASVPEPSSTALLGLGGFTLILRRRR